MFRELRRKKREISIEEAKALLENEKRGVFAVNGEDGYPYAIPVDYFYDREADKIYFHGARCGLKVDCLRKCDKICFTVFGNEHYKENDWAPYIQSTVVYGRCHLIDDPEITAKQVRTLAEKYYPSKEEIDAEMSRDIKAVQLYEITIEHICGKQIHEK